MTTNTLTYGGSGYTAMTVTNLQSLANDQTDPYAGWQSALVDNRATGALDYVVVVDLSTANTSPTDDRAAYVYLVPWTHSGSAWLPGANLGTTTTPTGSEGTASISDPNSMKGPVAIPYKIAQQRMQCWFSIAALCGGIVPEGWSLVIRNCSGAALSTGCVVAYRAVSIATA